MRSPRKTASSIECVTKNTVACVVRQSSSSRSCMVMRVIGSSAPKGSSMRIIRGCKIKVRAMATRWRIPPESSWGYLSWSWVDVETDPSDPATGMLVTLVAWHALALQSKRDIVEHRAVVKTGVVLKHHAAIGAWAGHWLAHHEHLATRGGMLGPQAGDQAQNRTLAAAARSQQADKFSLVDQILNDEIDVTNCGEFVGPPPIVGLGDTVELDDVRFANFVGLPDANEHPPDADLLARWRGHGVVDGSLFAGTHGASGSAECSG